MRLNWNPSASVSALHAAEAIHLHHWKLIDSRLTDSIAPYAENLGAWIEKVAQFQSPRFWYLLVGNAANLESNHDLANAVLRKFGLCTSDERMTIQLAGLISDLEAAFNPIYPKLLEQLPLRARPLQEHWLGYGPGLLAHLGRLTHKSLLVEEARVVLLQPAVGGSGVAHMELNLVRTEAVLVNPMVELPEVVRLAWMLSQLNLELPANSEHIGVPLIARLGPLAMLPATLAAAEVLELSRCNESMMELAIEQWHIPVPKDQDTHSQLVPALMEWWETYLQTRPAIGTAMQALAKMLALQ